MSEIYPIAREAAGYGAIMEILCHLTSSFEGHSDTLANTYEDMMKAFKNLEDLCRHAQKAEDGSGGQVQKLNWKPASLFIPCLETFG